ncbi:MAG: Gfo/Idh/MocA family oxidoreductase [Phycisphaerales bacterium]|nr:Gfo/Idh/MocA family oxidoreductase [Phycisphaerales bacterium]
MQVDRRMFLSQAAGMLGAAGVLSLASEVSAGAARPVIRPGAEPLPVGLIGAGRQGRAIMAEVQKIDAAKVVAVCDVDPSRLESGVKRTQGAEGFADHKALLDKRKDVQAIFIATPTHLHREVVADCLSAGKHVYCEAPLAHTVDDAKAILDAARAAKSIFHAGLEGRSNPIYQLARSFFRSDSVRDLVSLSAQHHQKTTWRAASSDSSREKALNWRLDPEVSIGLAGELGTHQFDVFHYYRGEYPKLVRGSGSIRVHKDGRTIADTIHNDLDFADGVQLHYGATLGNSYQGRHEVFCGSNAAIKLAWNAGWMFKEADAPTQGWEVYANRQQFHNDEGITLIADATKLASQGKLKEGVGLPFPSLYYAISDFFKSVLEGKAVASPAEEGYRATVVGIMANQAVLSGNDVAIEASVLGV